MEKLKGIFGLLFCLTLSICVFITLFIGGETKEQHIFALIFSPLCAAFGIFTFINDKRHKKAEERTKELITENKLFTSDAWRQRYLEYKEKNGFDTVDMKGMKADLIRRRRTLGTYCMMITGTVLLVYFLQQIISGHNGYTDKFYVILPAGLIISLFGFAYFWGFPVRTWIKKMGAQYEDIERSYVSGQMVTEGYCGINVGREYTVMFNETKLYYFPTRSIVNAGKKVIRERSYNTGVYIDTSYKYNVFVQVEESGGIHSYEVTLNAFKAEMICEVLQMLLSHPEDLETQYDETEALDMTII